jgi:C4-dicarboxylate transporter DctQ subunit
MRPASDGAVNTAPPLTEFSQTSEVHYRAPEGRLANVLRAWSAVENTIVGVLAAASLLIVVYTIFVRLLVPSLTPSWADETTVYVMIWATLIACSGVTAQNRHVRADLLTSGLSAQRQTVLEVLSYVCGAVFTAVLAWYGYLTTKDAWEFGDLSTTTLRFPMWIYYASLPVGAGLMTIRYLVLIGLTASGSRTPTRTH